MGYRKQEGIGNDREHDCCVARNMVAGTAITRLSTNIKPITDLSHLVLTVEKALAGYPL